MRPKDRENFPPNTKADQAARRKAVGAIGHKEKILVRGENDEELAKEGIELVKRGIIKKGGRGTKLVKRTFGKRLGNLFGADQEGIFNYIIFDVLVPAAKTTIQEIVVGGIEMVLFGSDPSRKIRPRNGVNISYGSFYKGDRHQKNYQGSSGYRRGRASNRLDGISFESRPEAQQVLDGMYDILEEYGQVTIAEYYELADLANISEYTDNAWGWYDLSNAIISHTAAGWEIKFPREKLLDD